MAYREFTDLQGGAWEVWDTHPEAARRESLAMAPSEGWLSFQSGEDRRRLRPIPAGWETQPDEQLRAWLTAAVPVSRVDTSRAGIPVPKRAPQPRPAPEPDPAPTPAPADEARSVVESSAEVNARVAESVRSLVEHTRDTIARVRRTIRGSSDDRPE